MGFSGGAEATNRREELVKARMEHLSLAHNKRMQPDASKAGAADARR